MSPPPPPTHPPIVLLGTEIHQSVVVNHPPPSWVLFCVHLRSLVYSSIVLGSYYKQKKMCTSYLSYLSQGVVLDIERDTSPNPKNKIPKTR